MALPAQAARLALVVGIDAYDSLRKLRNARADADTMAAALQKAGYAVDLRTDRTLRQLQDDVRGFRQRIRGGDEVIFFFSGHGVQIGAANYLLPTNVRGQNEDQVRDDGLALNKVLEDLRSAKPAFTLAVIDACRDNPFASTGKSIGGRGLTGVAGANGQMVIYAAGEGQQALDRLSLNDPVPNGLFTRVFARELNSPGVPVYTVLRRVRDEVYRLAQTVNHVQVPAIYDQVLGDFYFYPPRTNLQPPPAVASLGPGPSTVTAPTTPPPRQPSSLPAAAPSMPAAPQAASVCGLCPEVVSIPAGSFTMGSPVNEPLRSLNEGPQRRVSIASFALGRTEVTQGQWKAVMGANPSHFATCGDDCPVEQVSWNDAQDFIRRLNEKTGRAYRLPTEAEWEYAARAGSPAAFAWGARASREHANYREDDSRSGSPSANNRRTQPFSVAQFPPNAFGLYDMHGNVAEWVEDVWHEPYDGAPIDGTAWIHDGDQSRRVVRGGSWGDSSQYIRSASRLANRPGLRYYGTGLRLASTR